MRECKLSAKNLIGQTNLKKRLQDALSADSLVQHAFLFTGDPGMGKQSFAINFAQTLLCQNTQITNSSDGKTHREPCYKCPACQYFGAGTHPDFKILNRGKENIVKVDRVRRDVVFDIQTRPQLGKYKIYLINMDDLNEQGQNALLKSLEEPPHYAVFLLTATLQDNLLETILSRVAIFALQRYPDHEIRKILEANGITEDIAFIVQYAAGNPGNALRIASDKNYKEIRNSANDLFFRFPKAGRTEMLTTGLEFLKKNKEQTDLILDLWQGMLRDLLILLEDNNSEQIKQVDLESELTGLAQIYIDKRNASLAVYKANMLHSFNAINEVRRASQVNASFDGMLGQLLLTMRKDLFI
ncbi:MAG: hypothetical protein GX145_01070 [Clostridiaceae bacterium]|jgi:DNA polymerase-3 subunit delta'|nr:hypothetical protein [Clostridiaceae bacterium]